VRSVRVVARCTEIHIGRNVPISNCDNLQPFDLEGAGIRIFYRINPRGTASLS